MKKTVLMWALLLMVCSGVATAELVAVSQLGYHPSGDKRAISYTSATSGIATIYNANTNVAVGTYSLVKATDYSGAAVNCQGNNPCLVADFSSFTTPGTYYIQTSLGGRSPTFPINSNVYSTNAPIFLEFFNAELQQKSAYHADMHTGYTPAFTMIADGSFLMEADQAALATIHLGSAYRRNPQLFQTDKYAILTSGKPDMQEYLKLHVDYLKGLQGVQVQERTDGSGFRLDRGIKLEEAFVPGPTTLTSIDVYTPGDTPTKIQTIPVHSLCGANDGSTRWSTCMDDAANYYKCQSTEPCLNITYVDRTGVVTYSSTNFAVSQGWSYEFGCYFDVMLNTPQYVNRANPCMIFRPETSSSYTVQTLLAYMEALPAITDYSPTEGQALFNRAVQTQQYIKNTYTLTSSTDAAMYGTALFLLYDATGNATYLQDAYALRTKVSTTFVSDRTRGNEFYWEEYVRHKQALTNAGLVYTYGDNPEEFFRGKMYNDYKDLGLDRSISRTGERVFQFDNNVQFQNSRYMLAEALLATRTTELHPTPESFIPAIADSQLSWLTGMNGVQDGTGINPPIRSYSFIFGIGNYPTQFHSRYLVNSGYLSSSGGRVVGARGSNYQFYNGSDYVYFDGAATILGHQLGSLGNRYRNEPYTEPFVVGRTFTNGKTYIPGWINGAFDIQADTDIIFNYRDTLNTYENTETTNEMVAMATELFAYLDGQRNARTRKAMPQYSYTGPDTPPPPGNTTPPINNSNNTCAAHVTELAASCTGGTITQDVFDGCRTVLCTNGASSLKVLACDKPSNTNPQYFEMYKQFSSGTTVKEICLGATCLSNSGYEKSPLYPICTGGTQPPTCTPTAEVCDNKDNDCDAQIDEGNVCAPVCSPTTEVCDSVDNDCDGQIDEGGVCGGGACYNSVETVPVSCTSTITQDTWNGCRAVQCGTATNNIKVLACDKTGFFEVYRQSAAGSVPKICFGSTCVQNEGYAKSGTFPICTGGTPPPTCTPTTEVCDQKDNDCDAQVDEGNVCAPPPSNTTSASVSIAPWYPKGRDYVFVCNTNGFTPTRYDWSFGDGNAQYNSNRDVYYSYGAAGTYAVSCTASTSSISKQGTLSVTVS
jgi:hypothetical protein